jgi:hypothetical protein
MLIFEFAKIVLIRYETKGVRTASYEGILYEFRSIFETLTNQILHNCGKKNHSFI